MFWSRRTAQKSRKEVGKLDLPMEDQPAKLRAALERLFELANEKGRRKFVGKRDNDELPR
jgi:hypothetical protein